MQWGHPSRGPDLQWNVERLPVDEGLAASFRSFVEEVYAPLAEWLVRRRRELGKCCAVGICGPQGSGKTTGVRVLRQLLQSAGQRVAALSIDDLYLTRASRLELASTVHPLLTTRGPPGTHDVLLGARVLERLKNGESLALPAFSKAMDDRAPQTEWPHFEGPADIVLFEGWCVGARPQPEADLLSPVNLLELQEDSGGYWRRFVNSALGRYQPLFSELHLLVQLAPPSFEVVVRWREEQESKLRASAAAAEGTRVMTEEEVIRFVACYERITRHIINEMPHRVDALVELGEDREPRRLSLRLATGTRAAV